MMSRRINRRGLSGWLIVAVLFMQIATSAYACPMSRVQVDGSQEPMAGMPCAAMMSAGATLDVAQPGLCQQHCQQGTTQQPADTSPLAQVPPAALVPLFTVSPAVVVDTAPSQWAAHERRRDHAPPPAHSVLHCCYRI